MTSTNPARRGDPPSTGRATIRQQIGANTEGGATCDDGAVHVSILLFDDVDLLDAGGPLEVLVTANRLAERRGAEAPFEVDTVTMDGRAVTALGGLGLHPSAAADVLERTDLLVVPGAVDLDGPLGDRAMLEAIAAVGRRDGTTVASICTGAFLLAEVGLLDGRPWTTHWEDVDLLADRLGTDGATRGVRWVDAGPVVTGGALSSGIATALHLVERFVDRDLAERVANQLDHDWTETSSGGPVASS